MIITHGGIINNNNLIGTFLRTPWGSYWGHENQRYEGADRTFLHTSKLTLSKFTILFLHLINMQHRFRFVWIHGRKWWEVYSRVLREMLWIIWMLLWRELTALRKFLMAFSFHSHFPLRNALGYKQHYNMIIFKMIQHNNTYNTL